MASSADTKALLIQVTAATELAQRNMRELERSVASDAAKMDVSLKRVDAATGRMGNAFGVAKANIGGFLAGVGLSGLIAGGKAILDFADDLGTAADQAGVAVERYQTLKEGLRSLEIGTEQTDKALKTLTDTIGKVQSGVEDGATKALDKLGISAKITSGEITTADQLLDALAASSKTAGTEAQFTADLVDILGKKIGVDMAAALRDGGVALHGAEKAFRDTGNVISSEMIDKLADANEAIDAFEARARQGFTIFAANAVNRLDDVYLALLKVSRTVANFAPLPGMGSVAEYTDAIRGAEKRQATPTAVSAQLEKVRALQRRRDEVVAANRYDQAPVLGQVMSDLRSETATLQRLSADLETNTGEKRAAAPSVRRVAPPVVEPPKPARTGGAARSSSTGAAAPDFGPDLQNIDPRAGFGFNTLPDLGDISTLKADLADMADLSHSVSLQALLPTETQQRLEQFADGFTRDLSDGLADAIVQGDSLGDVLSSSLKRAGAELLSSGFSKLLKGGINAGVTALFGGGSAGKFFGFADGGHVSGPGGPRSDSIIARLSAGEFVVNAAATSKHYPLLEALNSNRIPGFADGGLAGLRVPSISGLGLARSEAGGAPRSLSLTMTVNGVSNRAEMEAIGTRAGIAAYQAAVQTSGQNVQSLGRPRLPGSLG